ncbi:MAG: CaiB/BaiF CoA transferase family protein, partial [Methyloligellaceae bacterium]
VYGRNKRSLALDFRADGAADLLARLFAMADIVLEGFRPGTFEKMGFPPEIFLDRYPDTILVRVSGFGQTGPYTQMPGFGTLVESMSGFASRNGYAESDPLLPPLALADMIAGLSGAFATVSALRAKEIGSKGGQIIDLSLLEPITSVLGPEAAAYQLTGKARPRLGNASNLSSPRNVYGTKDGHHIAMSGSTQAMAERIFRTIGRADMIDDPRYANNSERLKRRGEVDAAIGGWIAERSRDDVLKTFREAGVTASPIYDIADICEDRHFHERGIFVDLPDDELGTVAMHDVVPRLSGTPGAIRTPAPALGAHSDAVLKEAGLTQSECDVLCAKGVIAGKTTSEKVE